MTQEITGLEELEAVRARVEAAAREAVASDDEEKLEKAADLRSDAVRAAAHTAMRKAILPACCLLAAYLGAMFVRVSVFEYGWGVLTNVELFGIILVLAAIAAGVRPTKRALPWLKFCFLEGKDVKAARYALCEKRGVDMSRKARFVRAAVFFGIEAVVLAVIYALCMLFGDILWPILGELTFTGNLFGF